MEFDAETWLLAVVGRQRRGGTTARMGGGSQAIRGGSELWEWLSEMLGGFMWVLWSVGSCWLLWEEFAGDGFAWEATDGGGSRWFGQWSGM